MVPKLRFTSFKDTWTSAYLSKLVVSLDAGVSVNSIDELPGDNEYSILKTSCVSFGYFDERERKKVVNDEVSRLKEMLVSNSILISRMNTPALVGANAYIKDAPRNTFVPDRLWQVKVNDNICNIKWLASFLSSDKGRSLLKEQASGTSNSMKNITKKDVFQIMLAFPCKEEQTIIADFLSSVDEKITLLHKQYDLLCQYKKSMMQKIFSQELWFKDDNGGNFPQWEEVELKKIASKVNTKNRDNSVSTVLTNSATQGIVSQQSYFEREIVTESNLTGYYVVRIGDFVYNPRISSTAPVGPIKMNELTQGVMSPLYTVFRFEKGLLKFYQYFFESSVWHDYMKSVANSGARHDRMNISGADFFDLPVPQPSDEEQTKIARFLSAIDDKITTKKTELDKLKTWKQGLLQQMFI